MENKYYYGLYIFPKITHEESYLTGFRESSIKIHNHFDFDLIRGRSIREIVSLTGNRPEVLIKDKYMYFLMLDKIPDKFIDYGCFSTEVRWMAYYYYEINIEKNSNKVIEEVIRDAIQEELKRETLKGSFYNRAHNFFEQYHIEISEENEKAFIKSLHG